MNFDTIFYLILYIWIIIFNCNSIKILMINLMLFFRLCLCNLMCISYLQHISSWNSNISSAWDVLIHTGYNNRHWEFTECIFNLTQVIHHFTYNRKTLSNKLWFLLPGLSTIIFICFTSVYVINLTIYCYYCFYFNQLYFKEVFKIKNVFLCTYIFTIFSVLYSFM